MTDHARDDRAREIDTAALRALCERATPGPWKWWTSCSWRRLRRDDPRGHDEPVAEPYVCSDGHPDLVIRPDDMEFISKAREVLPAALDEIDRLRAEVEDARASGYAAGIADAAKVALDYTAREDDYPSAVARDFYESAVVDAVSDIAASIRALSTSEKGLNE